MMMVDKVEAQKNLEILKQNQKHLMSYNHLFSSHAFKESCTATLRKTTEQIKSLEYQLSKWDDMQNMRRT